MPGPRFGSEEFGGGGSRENLVLGEPEGSDAEYSGSPGNSPNEMDRDSAGSTADTENPVRPNSTGSELGVIDERPDLELRARSTSDLSPIANASPISKDLNFTFDKNADAMAKKQKKEK